MRVSTLSLSHTHTLSRTLSHSGESDDGAANDGDDEDCRGPGGRGALALHPVHDCLPKYY